MFPGRRVCGLLFCLLVGRAASVEYAETQKTDRQTNKAIATISTTTTKLKEKKKKKKKEKDKKQQKKKTKKKRKWRNRKK